MLSSKKRAHLAVISLLILLVSLGVSHASCDVTVTGYESLNANISASACINITSTGSLISNGYAISTPYVFISSNGSLRIDRGSSLSSTAVYNHGTLNVSGGSYLYVSSFDNYGDVNFGDNIANFTFFNNSKGARFVHDSFVGNGGNCMRGPGSIPYSFGGSGAASTYGGNGYFGTGGSGSAGLIFNSSSASNF